MHSEHLPKNPPPHTESIPPEEGSPEYARLMDELRSVEDTLNKLFDKIAELEDMRSEPARHERKKLKETEQEFYRRQAELQSRIGIV